MSNAYKIDKRFPVELEFDAAWRSRKRNHVPDVADTGDHHQKALKPQAKAAVGYTAEAAGIQVPPVRVFVHFGFVHACFKHFQTLLTLAATDDLADARYQHVHGCHCFAVIIYRACRRV